MLPAHRVEIHLREVGTTGPYRKTEYSSNNGSAEAHMMKWQSQGYEVMSVTVRGRSEFVESDQVVDMINVDPLVNVGTEVVLPDDPELQPIIGPVDNPSFDELVGEEE